MALIEFNPKQQLSIALNFKYVFEYQDLCLVNAYNPNSKNIILHNIRLVRCIYFYPPYSWYTIGDTKHKPIATVTYIRRYYAAVPRSLVFYLFFLR